MLTQVQGSQEHDNSASTSIHQSRLLARDSISLPQRSNSNDQPPAQAAPHHSPLRASAPAPHSAASHLPQRRVEQPTATRDHSSSAMDGQHDKEEDGDFAAGVALLSLNSASEPHFLGASSGSTWAKLVSSVWRRPGISLYHTNPIRSGQSHGTPSDVSQNQLQPHQCLLPSPGDSEILFKACYMHVQARYAFPDWIELRRWISQQESLLRASVENDVNTPEGKVSRVAMFFILWVKPNVFELYLDVTCHQYGLFRWFKVDASNTRKSLDCCSTRGILCKRAMLYGSHHDVTRHPVSNPPLHLRSANETVLLAMFRHYSGWSCTVSVALRDQVHGIS